MKAKIIFFLFVFLLNSPAFSSNDILGDYCKKTHKKLGSFNVALKNDGRYKVRTTRPGGRTPEIEMKFYRGCRFDTPWIDEMYNTLCEDDRAKPVHEIQSKASKLVAPESFLFFFEGAGDFNAYDAFTKLQPVNLDGSEGVDLNIGHGTGLSSLNLMMKLPSHTLAQKRNNIELHYHSGSGFTQRENYHSAIACAKDTKYYLDILNSLRDQNKLEPKWMVMGYSNGGSLAIMFQNDVTNFGIGIDLAFTIDPIVQAIAYPFHKFKSHIGKRNEKTKRFVNLYQQIDRDSLPGFELRGKPVSEADVNLVLDQMNSDVGDGHHAHIYIASDYMVWIKSNCEFRNIFLTNPTECKY